MAKFILWNIEEIYEDHPSALRATNDKYFEFSTRDGLRLAH
jgi:hypothetical protein